MATIILENMEFYANHGVLEHEKILGNTFIVNLELDIDISKAAMSDNLNDTLNYQLVYDVVKEQINIHSDLIENLSNRISENLINKFDKIQSLTLKLSKLNPPLGAKVEKVSIIIRKDRA